MNEKQRQAWNRFWCIKTDDAQSQGQYATRGLLEQQTQYLSFKQNAPVLYENLLNRANASQLHYKIQKKPFPDPLGGSEYEFVFR
jgi:hypothetical protein